MTNKAIEAVLELQGEYCDYTVDPDFNVRWTGCERLVDQTCLIHGVNRAELRIAALQQRVVDYTDADDEETAAERERIARYLETLGYSPAPDPEEYEEIEGYV